MTKKSKTFRLNEDVYQKLIDLENAEKLKRKRGLSSKTMTDIVEEAISSYHIAYLDQNSGDDYMRRITSVVENLLSQYFNQYDVVLTKLLQTALFNKEAGLTTLKLLNRLKFIERPKSDKELRAFISEMGSVYEAYILDKILNLDDTENGEE